MTTPPSFLLSSYAARHVAGEHWGSAAMLNRLRFRTGTELDEARGQAS